LGWVGVKTEGPEVGAHYIQSGYYGDGVVFADDLTKQCARAFSDMNNFVVKFTYNPRTNKFSIDVQSKGLLLCMSAQLQKVMGVSVGTNHLGNQVVFASSVFKLNHGFNLMYVYCGIASYTAVGDTKAPRLRVHSVSGKHGEIMRTIFTHQHYVPVGRREFEAIEININTEHGKPMPFTSRKSVVKLRFRRRHSLLPAS
jgi:hypothetical protein